MIPGVEKGPLAKVLHSPRIPDSEKRALLARANSLATKLANQGVDRTDLRRMVRYLVRTRNHEALRVLMAAPPPRPTDSAKTAWGNLRLALEGEAAACSAFGTIPGTSIEDALVSRLIYVLGWAGRLHAGRTARRG
jgi:hypothetical protein